MSAQVSTCRHVMCWHMQDKIPMVGIRGAESGFTCWHMPGHVGTYQHMSACPQVLTHASIWIRSKWSLSEVSRLMSHVGTCHHMPAHISTCRHVHSCWHMPACKMRFKWLVSEVLRVVSHVRTCRHISAHVGMSTGADICQHLDKV